MRRTYRFFVTPVRHVIPKMLHFSNADRRAFPPRFRLFGCPSRRGAHFGCRRRTRDFPSSFVTAARGGPLKMQIIIKSARKHLRYSSASDYLAEGRELSKFERTFDFIARQTALRLISEPHLYTYLRAVHGILPCESNFSRRFLGKLAEGLISARVYLSFRGRLKLKSLSESRFKCVVTANRTSCPSLKKKRSP